MKASWVPGRTVRCDLCGAPCPDDENSVPTCLRHGPRWVHARNALCASTVIFNDSDQVLLSRRAHEPYAAEWETPGGFVELGEHPATAACREVREELGLELVLTGLVGTYLAKGAAGGFLVTIVYAGTAHGTITLSPEEVSEANWFGEADVPASMAGDHRQRVEDFFAGAAVDLPTGGAPAQVETVTDSLHTR